MRLPVHTKLELDQEFNNKTSSTSILRLTFRAIINDKKIWCEMNNFKFKQRFPDVKNAVFGKNSLKSKFRILNNILIKF